MVSARMSTLRCFALLVPYFELGFENLAATTYAVGV
jgi:hypothetical protein